MTRKEQLKQEARLECDFQDMKVIGAPLSKGGYSVPEGGIPESDLSEELQAKLAGLTADIGYAGDVLQLDANGKPEWVVPSAGTTPDTNISPISTNAVQNKAIIEYVEGVGEGNANIDGYYETLGVGTATNLKGQNIVNGEFVYRKSGGNDAVATGAAFLEGIKGNTIEFNQLADNSHFPDATRAGVLWSHDTNGIITANGTASANENIQGWLRLPAGSIPVSHKVLILCRLLSGSITGRFGCDYSFSVTTRGENVLNSPFIATAESNLKSCVFYYEGAVFNNAKFVFNYIDLTLIYGTGNEPSTPEQFEADYFRWFGKPLTYEPYDEGSLRSVKMSGLKTIGFNQWDEINWDIGAFLVNGSIITTNGFDKAIHCTEYIKILKGVSYFFYCKNQDMSKWYAAEYDENKNFLQRQVFNKGIVYTPSSNATYFKFATENNYGSSTYLNDICINISDTNKNGTYEEYWESEASVPVTTMTGQELVDGEPSGTSVVVFPDGMLSAGDVHDEIYKQGGKTYAIKRVVRVNLVSLSWNYEDNFQRFVSSVLSMPPKIYPQYLMNEINTYGYINDNNPLGAGTLDNSLCYYNGKIYIRNLSYTDAASFKTAMSGVMMDYELAEPIIYELDEFTLPEQFMVDALGTEEIIPVTGELAVAPIFALRYGVNAVGTIQNLPKGYISEGSMDNFLSPLSSAMEGTWTKTWNDTTNKYEFSFTPNT